MAYLRREKEIVEIDYPITKVWEAVAKAAENLDWEIEEKNETSHQVKTKTKSNFMAYASLLTIEAFAEGENKTRITVSAETPVTTITGIIDFGRTRERIDSFLLALVKVLKSQETDK
jgi:hypothetical protein